MSKTSEFVFLKSYFYIECPGKNIVGNCSKYYYVTDIQHLSKRSAVTSLEEIEYNFQTKTKR